MEAVDWRSCGEGGVVAACGRGEHTRSRPHQEKSGRKEGRSVRIGEVAGGSWWSLLGKGALPIAPPSPTPPACGYGAVSARSPFKGLRPRPSLPALR